MNRQLSDFEVDMRRNLQEIHVIRDENTEHLEAALKSFIRGEGAVIVDV